MFVYYLSMHRRFLLVVIICFLAFPRLLMAGVNPGSKFLFLNESKKSFPLRLTNMGNEPVEVWVDAKYGYLVSDDSGKGKIVYDTLGAPPRSAAPWINMYPARFHLNPQETQIVRLTAAPPPGLTTGEYWARILVASQTAKSSLDQAKKKKALGIEIIERVGLPFHYRKGEVTTGLDIQAFTARSSDKNLIVNLNMTRKGNASFWGVASFRLLDSQHRRVWSQTKDVVVYDSFNGVYELDRTGIPAGEYTLEVDIKTEGRKDVRKSDLIQSAPIRLSQAINLN